MRGAGLAQQQGAQQRGSRSKGGRTRPEVRVQVTGVPDRQRHRGPPGPRAAPGGRSASSKVVRGTSCRATTAVKGLPAGPRGQRAGEADRDRAVVARGRRGAASPGTTAAPARGTAAAGGSGRRGDALPGGQCHAAGPSGQPPAQRLPQLLGQRLDAVPPGGPPGAGGLRGVRGVRRGRRRHGRRILTVRGSGRRTRRLQSRGRPARGLRRCRTRGPGRRRCRTRPVRSSLSTCSSTRFGEGGDGGGDKDSPGV